MKAEEIKKLFEILKEIAIEQSICEVSGNDWGNKIITDLEELKKDILKGKKIPR